jgi:hypothetical protein
MDYKRGNRKFLSSPLVLQWSNMNHHQILFHNRFHYFLLINQHLTVHAFYSIFTYKNISIRIRIP